MSFNNEIVEETIRRGIDTEFPDQLLKVSTINYSHFCCELNWYRTVRD